MNPGPQNKTLAFFSLFTAGATFALILAGGLVTSHEAGLAVPDWPLSYGQVFPPMVGNVFWEHGHRMIAAAVGFLTVILAIWIQIKDRRRWVKRLGWIAVTAVILQGILGGLTVRMMLPPPVSIMHATLAQTFFCLMITLTYFLSRSVPFPIDESRAMGFQRARRLTTVTAGLIYLQLILGAVVRHTGHGVVIHIGTAFLILLHLGLVARRLFGYHDVGKIAVTTGFLAITQFFLGLGSFITTQVLERGYKPSLAEVVLTSAHQTLGALILGLIVLINLYVYHESVPAAGRKA